MDILIIGGTGNISAPLPAMLQQAGCSVGMLNRGSKPAPDGVAHLVADLEQPDRVAAVLAGVQPRIVIDFMCFTPDQAAQRIAAFGGGQVERYLFVSSATVYAKPHQRLPITEAHPLGNPYSAYAQAKQACEAAFAASDLPTVMIRPSHTLGPTWIPSPLSGSDWTISARILAGRPVLVPDDGRSLWTLTAAEDVCGAIVGLASNPPPAGTAVHITGDEALSWNTIYHEIGLALGQAPTLAYRATDDLAAANEQAKEKLQGDKSHHALFDNLLIKQLVPGWRCQIRPHELIQRAVVWHQADPSRQVINQQQDQLLDQLLATLPASA